MRTWFLDQGLLEEGDGPLPGELGCLRRVARRRRVVVERVVHAVIDKDLVVNARRLQRIAPQDPQTLAVLPAVVDTRVLKDPPGGFSREFLLSLQDG